MALSKNELAVKESPLDQGRDEERRYALTTTPWGSAPTNVLVTAYDAMESFKDVSSTVLSGSHSIAGDIITLPVLKSLTMGHVYRVEIKFTVGGNVEETHVDIHCVR